MQYKPSILSTSHTTVTPTYTTGFIDKVHAVMMAYHDTKLLSKTAVKFSINTEINT